MFHEYKPNFVAPKYIRVTIIYLVLYLRIKSVRANFLPTGSALLLHQIGFSTNPSCNGLSVVHLDFSALAVSRDTKLRPGITISTHFSPFSRSKFGIVLSLCHPDIIAWIPTKCRDFPAQHFAVQRVGVTHYRFPHKMRRCSDFPPQTS